MLRPSTAAIVPDLPERSLERAGCPTCGEPLEIRTNGLTGEISTRCPTCIARAERAQFQATYRRRAIETVARDFGLTVEEAERRLRTDPAIVGRIAPRPTEATCEQCGERFAIARVGIIPRRCGPCSGRLTRKGIRPTEIACERCARPVAVQRLGIIPRFCAECRLGSRARPNRPTVARCPRCEQPFRVKRLGPVPTHCKPCQLIQKAEKMRTALLEHPPPA